MLKKILRENTSSGLQLNYQSYLMTEKDIFRHMMTQYLPFRRI